MKGDRHCESCGRLMRSEKPSAAVKLPRQREKVLCGYCANVAGVYFDAEGICRERVAKPA